MNSTLRVIGPAMGWQRLYRFTGYRGCFLVMLSLLAWAVTAFVVIGVSADLADDGLGALDVVEWLIALVLLAVALLVPAAFGVLESRHPFLLHHWAEDPQRRKVGIVDASSGEPIGARRAGLRAVLRMLLAPVSLLIALACSLRAGRLPHDLIVGTSAVLAVDARLGAAVPDTHQPAVPSGSG